MFEVISARQAKARIHDRHDGNLESVKRHLEWEQGRMAQLDDEERAVFQLTPKPSTAQHAFTPKP
jgi:hypothetical protein